MYKLQDHSKQHEFGRVAVKELHKTTRSACPAYHQASALSRLQALNYHFCVWESTYTVQAIPLMQGKLSNP